MTTTCSYPVLDSWPQKWQCGYCKAVRKTTIKVYHHTGQWDETTPWVKPMPGRCKDNPFRYGANGKRIPWEFGPHTWRLMDVETYVWPPYKPCGETASAVSVAYNGICEHIRVLAPTPFNRPLCSDHAMSLNKDAQNGVSGTAKEHLTGDCANISG